MALPENQVVLGQFHIYDTPLIGTLASSDARISAETKNAVLYTSGFRSCSGAFPLMLRAIAAAKKKNDRIDAGKICDCLRCDFLPECYMAPTAIRDRRRTLRYRNLLVRQMVQMKNKISTLQMEAGVSYDKKKLHQAGDFRELLASNPGINEGLGPLLRLGPEMVVRLSKTENALVSSASPETGQFLELSVLR